MSWWRGRAGYRREVEEEIRTHLELRARELEEEGMSPEEAWKAAVDAFGDPDRIEEEVLEMREQEKEWGSITAAVAAFVQDLGYATRFLTRNKVFTVVAASTLALGIGATTAIYSLVDAALFRSPAVDDPASLVALYTSSSEGNPRSQTSYPDYVDYRDQSTQLSDIAATTTLFSVNLGGDGAEPAPVTVGAATGNYFSILGVEASLGRLLQGSDDEFRSGAPVAVLTHGLWRNRFGEDPTVIGRSIRLNGRAFEVVGVLPEDYRGLTLGDAPPLWTSLQSSTVLDPYNSDGELWTERGARGLQMLVGRLSPGSTVEQTRGEMATISERLNQAYPAARNALVDRYVTVDPLESYLLPGGPESSLPRFMWLLMSVVGTTLLLACANLANLLLARASARGGEIGVRIAIGAGRRRLIRQLLAESLLLAALGGATGLLVAVGLVRALGAYELPGGIAIAVLDAGLDGGVLVTALVLTLLTAVLFGLAPALHSTRPGAFRGIHPGAGVERGPGSGRLRRGLVAAQVALCMVLLVGAGLFLRTMRNAFTADLGFRYERVAMGQVPLTSLGFGRDDGLAFAETVRQRLDAHPAVQSAAVAGEVPFQGGYGRRGVSIEGYAPAPGESMELSFTPVSVGYFETLGIPLIAGRRLGPEDDTGAEPVAVINRSMAERYWPDGDALGGGIEMSGSSMRVVGVVGDVHWTGIDEAPRSTIFTPFAQAPDRAFGLVLTVAAAGSEPEALLPAIRNAVRSIDDGLTFRTLATMDQLIGDVLMPQRLGAALLSAFGLLALILAAVGIVGVVTYTVREQRRSIGVRMALGAGRSEILQHLVRGMAMPVGTGLATGLVVALALDGAVEQFLYGVSPGDPLTYGVIAVGLAGVAVVATLIPAREATRVDPLSVLRAE